MHALAPPSVLHPFGEIYSYAFRSRYRACTIYDDDGPLCRCPAPLCVVSRCLRLTKCHKDEEVLKIASWLDRHVPVPLILSSSSVQQSTQEKELLSDRVIYVNTSPWLRKEVRRPLPVQQKPLLPEKQVSSTVVQRNSVL